jgi:hypothetical protein
MKLPKGLSSCPFCGGENLHGWAELPDHENKKCFYYKTKGEIISLTCGNCGIGIQFGYFGNGISKKNRNDMIKQQWNRRHLSIKERK